jgi:hypothetical protein
MHRFSLLLFLLIAFATALPAQSPNEYTVGVYYYPWYAGDFHGRNYLRQFLSPPQLPALGEYDDRDPAVIERHLNGCRDAGVDFWVASWWGPASREDATLRDTVLTSPHLGDIRIAIFYETAGRMADFTDDAHIEPDITHFAAHYFAHPNYLKIDGRPVLFVT